MRQLFLFVSVSILSLLLISCSGTTDEHYLFIGTYTSGVSEGVYVYKFNTQTGNVDSVGAAAGVRNPSYLAATGDGSNLYAVNEMSIVSQQNVES